jgi:hypothetical protein
LITLTAATEPDLERLCQKLESEGVMVTRFAEADLAEELTAIACIGSPSVRRATSNFPLALREVGGPSEEAARRRECALRSGARAVLAASGGEA